METVNPQKLNKDMDLLKNAQNTSMEKLQRLESKLQERKAKKEKGSSSAVNPEAILDANLDDLMKSIGESSFLN